EEDDPDLEPKEATELWVARLKSFAYAWIWPYIDSEASTSVVTRPGSLADIPSHVSHDQSSVF
ncbi:hypothetical protein HAX54_048235, partial [Datura stramonium]|nr:hypothetical protein [Datura stramonium]